MNLCERQMDTCTSILSGSLKSSLYLTVEIIQLEMLAVGAHFKREVLLGTCAANLIIMLAVVHQH